MYSYSKDKQKTLKMEKQWNLKKPLLEKRLKIIQEKKKIRNTNRLSTSKLLILFLFINCSIIEGFTIYITYKSLLLAETTMITPDFSPLLTLIGAVVGEVISFAIYSVKASKENCKNGITYELAMQNNKEENFNEYNE